MNKTFAAVAAFAVAAFMSVSASAVTVVVNDGNVVTIATGSEFIGGIVGDGGFGTWTVQFDAATDLLATSSATIGPLVAGTFTNLTMSWVSLATGMTLSSIDVISDVSLLTAFSNPDNLSQLLVLAWGGSLLNATFGVEISAVPLPAGLLLIITAFSGLAIVGRRRREVAAV